MNIRVAKKASELNLSGEALKTMPFEEVKRRLDGMVDGVISEAVGEYVSPAARRAAKIAAKKDAPAREVIKRIDVPGEDEPYYVRAFDPVAINRFQMYTSRTRDGRIDVTSDSKLRSFMGALLYCGVVRGPDDKRPLFKMKYEPGDVPEPYSLVWDWVDSEDLQIGGTALILQAAVVFQNQDYFNVKADEEARAAFAAAGINLDTVDPREKKEFSPTSMTSGSETPTAGSDPKPTTTEPSSSPPSPSPQMESAATDMATQK